MPAEQYAMRDRAPSKMVGSRLKLTVNEAKTRTCKLPADSFDFLSYTAGRGNDRDKVEPDARRLGELFLPRPGERGLPHDRLPRPPANPPVARSQAQTGRTGDQPIPRPVPR